MNAPSPSPSLPIPLPATSNAGLVVALFLILLFGTSGVLWWQVLREYRRRAVEALRRMGPADD